MSPLVIPVVEEEGAPMSTMSVEVEQQKTDVAMPESPTATAAPNDDGGDRTAAADVLGPPLAHDEDDFVGKGAGGG